MGSGWGNQRGEAGGSAVAWGAWQEVGVGTGAQSARSLCSKPAGTIQGRWRRGRLRSRIVHRAGWGRRGPLPPPSTLSPPLAPTRAARGVRTRDQLSSLFWGHGLGPAPRPAPDAPIRRSCVWGSSAFRAGGGLSGDRPSGTSACPQDWVVGRRRRVRWGRPPRCGA